MSQAVTKVCRFCETDVSGSTLHRWLWSMHF